jgi:hypothetical protein
MLALRAAARNVRQLAAVPRQAVSLQQKRAMSGGASTAVMVTAASMLHRIASHSLHHNKLNYEQLSGAILGAWPSGA